MIDCSDLIGRPYGADGLDCWALAVEVCRRAGTDLPATPPDAASGHAGFTRLDGPEPWAIAAIRLGASRLVRHVAVVLPCRARIIHVRQATGVCIERIDRWRPLIVGYYAWQP